MYRLRAGELYIEFPFGGPSKLTDRVLSGEVYRLFSKEIQNTEAGKFWLINKHQVLEGKKPGRRYQITTTHNSD